MIEISETSKDHHQHEDNISKHISEDCKMRGTPECDVNLIQFWSMYTMYRIKYCCLRIACESMQFAMFRHRRSMLHH
jgi:hypothetical protein